MRLVQSLVTFTLTLTLAVVVHGQSEGRVTFKDDTAGDRTTNRESPVFPEAESRTVNGSRQGKNLFNLFNLGAGRKVDPYVAKTNQGCLSGDLAQCFKAQALEYFSDFFDHDAYNLNDDVKVVRMSRDIVKHVDREPYEYSGEARSADSEWDQMLKFILRKAEKFVKTTAFEIALPSSEVGENGVYAPRFFDEIVDEIDTLENKKDTLFSRHQFKKLLLPMLIVLKLFKLKLLLFLPLILGLASFKKFLGLMAFVIPGLIGFFKLYKPLTQNYQPPVYSQSGIGYPYYKDNSNNHYVDHNVNHGEEYAGGYHGDSVSFGQDLAYQGYREYQS